MKTSFKVTADLELEIRGNRASELSGGIELAVPENLRKEDYLESDGHLTQVGVDMAIATLLVGVTATINYSHKKGYMDRQKFLEKVVEELKTRLESTT
jgi:hypothetical protein